MESSGTAPDFYPGDNMSIIDRVRKTRAQLYAELARLPLLRLNKQERSAIEDELIESIAALDNHYDNYPYPVKGI